MLLTSIIAFLIIFSALILVHEWGHFTTARKFGVKVEEFGLGLPPLGKKLWKDKKGTEYTLNWLPLGGFVRMKGEDAHDSKLIRAKDSFAHKKVWQRIVIVCAGVFMNFVTGFMLLIFVFSVGSTYLVPLGNVKKLTTDKPGAELVSQKRLGILVQSIVPGGTAENSDLKKYDFIAAVDGKAVDSLDGFKNILAKKPGEEVTLSIIRRNYRFKQIIKISEEGKLGVMISDPLMAVRLRYPIGQAIQEASKETVRLTGLIFGAIGNLFGTLLTQFTLPNDIGGPVAIAKETFYRSTDIIALLNFAAMLSITLAVFNILPIPALDGGRLVFLLYEAIMRRRPSPQVEAHIHAAGFIALIGLILLISWQDLFG